MGIECRRDNEYSDKKTAEFLYQLHVY